MVGANVLTQTVILNATDFLTRSDQVHSRNMTFLLWTYCVTKVTQLDRELTTEQATAVGPLRGTPLTVKLNFVVLVSRQTEQADVPSAEGSVGRKASAAATRRFQRQHEPLAGCRAVHFHRAAQVLSNTGEIPTAKPFSIDCPNG